MTHPAWQGGTGKVVERGQLSKFENRFGGMFSAGTEEEKEEPKAEEKVEAKAEDKK
jgi:hypothetical protein